MVEITFKNIYKMFIYTLLSLCFLLFSLCACADSSPKNDMVAEKEAIVDFCKDRYFMHVPIDCIEYVGFSKEYQMHEFFVEYNAKEYYKDLGIYDSTDEIEIFKETFFVDNEQENFVVYTHEFLEER